MTKLRASAGILVMVLWLTAFDRHPVGKTDTAISSLPGFLVISDIHLHEGDDQTQAITANSDSGKDLWDSAENKIRSVLSGKGGTGKPKFIICLGDLPWHTRDSTQVPDAMESAGKILGDLRKLAEQADIPLLYVPGNNDSEDGDYAPFSSRIFQHDPGGIRSWPVIDGSQDRAAATNPCLGDTSALSLGCYTAYPLNKVGGTTQGGLTEGRVTEGGLTVIVLNTNIFTARYGRMAGKERQMADADTALSWLRGQLGAAAALHQQVLLAMHVPPGKDGYLPAQPNRETCTGKFKDLWDPSLQVQVGGHALSVQNVFLDLVDEYQGSIVGIVGSHTHMDGIRLLRNRAGDSTSALLVSVPGIAPGHGNNPGIKFISYDPKKFQLQNFITLYEDFYPGQSVKTWGDRHYSFRQVFHAGNTGSMLDRARALPLDSLRQYNNSIYTVYNGDGYSKGNCVDTTLYVHYQP